jgi:hypothetical protein
MANEQTRQGPIEVLDGGNICHVMIDGDLWAAVEWSEKHQTWCIEDSAGECLAHPDCIVGKVESKEAAIAIAKEMIRDGRMPDPETAEKNRRDRLKQRREKRAKQPAQIRRKAERDALRRQCSATSEKAWDAECEEQEQPPLCLYHFHIRMTFGCMGMM